MSDRIDDTPAPDLDLELAAASGDPAVRHAAVEAAIAAYVLGALDPDEATIVAAHLPGCARCADQLADTERVVHALPLLLPTVVPPASAKSALMARIAERAPAAVETAPAPHALRRRHAARRLIGRERPAHPVPVEAPRPGTAHPWWSGFVAPMASAVPLVIALAVVGGWAMDLRSQVNQLQLMPNLLSNENGSMWEMDPGPNAPASAVGRVVADDNRAVLIVSNLSTAENGTYRVLVERGEEMLPAGELTVDEGGDGQTTLDLDQSFADYNSVHVQAVPLNPDATATVDALSAPIRSALTDWAQDPGTGGDADPGEDN